MVIEIHPGVAAADPHDDDHRCDRAVSVARNANCCLYGLGLGAGDKWIGLRDLGRVGRVVLDRERSVEGSNSSAIRGVRERAS